MSKIMIPPVDVWSGVQYTLCSNYIGETKRALETRLNEHEAATRRGEVEKLAIAEHA